LPLRTRMLHEVHAAEHAHRFAGERNRRGHDRFGRILIASGQEDGDDKSANNTQRHNSLRAKNTVTSPSGAAIQTTRPSSSAPTPVLAVPASPAMPANWLTLNPVRLV